MSLKYVSLSYISALYDFFVCHFRDVFRKFLKPFFKIPSTKYNVS